MASSDQPNPRTKKLLSPKSIRLILLLTIELLFSFASVQANPNPFLSYFSRFPRHVKTESVETFLSSSKTKHKGSPKIGPKPRFESLIQLSMNKAQSARALAYNLSLSYHKTRTQMFDPVDDCIELLDDTLDMLANIKNTKTKGNNDDHVDDDVRTWLSAALTNQGTCMQSLNENSKVGQQKGMMDYVARNLSDLLTNSLDLYVSVNRKKGSKPVKNVPNGGRRLLEDFSAWVCGTERKLLEASVEELRPYAVVAGDGSGTHKSVGEALKLPASLRGNGRTVIHVKAGTYHENVRISTRQKNVMLVGDGKGKTVIVSNRSNKDGWTTFRSATVAAMGDGFIARDITFVNSAGPAKNQAVALRIGSDRSVVYRCSVHGYQDTLYAHSKRQFYRDNDIYGTQDFIFGNSAAVFQNCNIFARKPLPGQNNFVTAQGRTSPHQNTGISIHNCKIAAAVDIGKTATYLGRPWQKYSRTVVMQSYLDGSVHPSGWGTWIGGFALNTLYYGEYSNSGPGSNVSDRVKWAGYHPGLTMREAEKFTVSRFIDGTVWLPSTGVAYHSGLLK